MKKSSNTGTSYANPHAVTNLTDLNLDITYDNNGNVTAEIVQPYQWNFFEATWDYNNRMMSSGGWSDATTYAYDHIGQRILMDIGDQYFGTTTIYANKYYNVRTDKETEATTETLHAYDNKGNLIATVENDGQNFTLYYDHTDHLGGTGLMTDQDGEVEQVLDYYPFGGIRFNQQENSFDEQRKFTGHEYDSQSDLTYMGARYYAGVAGRFISQDPVFIDVGDMSSVKVWKNGLTNPQRFNSYSYSRNNPLTFLDLFGLWDSETGTVEKGDTLTDITNQINSLYSTNYSIFDISKLNNISNPDKIYVGQTIKPNGDTPDVSFELNTLNKEHAQYAQEENYGDIKFGLKFMPKGDWDLKSQTGTFCTQRSCGGQNYTSYIYNGKEINYDAPTNIHYGYVGNAIGQNLTKLLFAGDIVQNVTNLFAGRQFPTLDPGSDKAYIMEGYFLYNK